MGWVAHKAADNAEPLAGLRVSLEAANEASAKAEKVNAEALARVERKLDEMLPRHEFDARVLGMEQEGTLSASAHIGDICGKQIWAGGCNS